MKLKSLFGKRKTPFEAAGTTRHAVGFGRRVEAEKSAAIPDKEKTRAMIEPEPENERASLREPIPEGDAVFAVLSRPVRNENTPDTPEYLFGRMDTLNPYRILSWIPARDFSLDETLEGSKSDARVPAVYTFRNVPYRLERIAHGPMGTIYRGTAVVRDIRRHHSHPETIIFKAIPRNSVRNGVKDANTLQEIALMTALHPDPQAPKDSLAHAVRWAEGAGDRKGEALRWDVEDEPAKEVETEAFPMLYEAIQYRIKDWKGFGIVMEDLGKETYQERMKTDLSHEEIDKADVEKQMAYADKMADGLHEMASLAKNVAELHAHGIVHRDLKPANLFQREDGRIILADLGIGFHPYYRGREFLPKEIKEPYDTMRAYGAALYGLLQEHGIGFGTIRSDLMEASGSEAKGKEWTPKKAEVRQEGKHLSEEDELALWETMRLIASAVYTAEVSDQERLALLQQAFLSAKNTYERMAMTYPLPEVQPMLKSDQRLFLQMKLRSEDTGVPEVQGDLAKHVARFDPTYRIGRVKAIGTPHYMAPEQAQGIGLPKLERNRIDVFAVGLIAMERLHLGKVRKRMVPSVHTDDPDFEEKKRAYLKEMNRAVWEIVDARVKRDDQGIEWARDSGKDPILMRLRDFLRDELMAKEPGERPEAWEAARIFEGFAGEYRNVERRQLEKQAKEAAQERAERAAG